jgi:hypothetical protein
MPDSGDAVTDAAGRFAIRRARKGQAEVRLYAPEIGSQWLDVSVTGPDAGELAMPGTAAEQPADEPIYYDENE